MYRRGTARNGTPQIVLSSNNHWVKSSTVFQTTTESKRHKENMRQGGNITEQVTWHNSGRMFWVTLRKIRHRDSDRQNLNKHGFLIVECIDSNQLQCSPSLTTNHTPPKKNGQNESHNTSYNYCAWQKASRGEAD